MPIDRVAVLGGGLMGSGLAEAIAIAGVPVVLRMVASGRLGRKAGRGIYDYAA